MEIEKAKERCNSIVKFCKNNKECQENKICSDCYIEIEDVKAIKTLLQYIDQLEQYLERISKQLENVALDQIPIAIKELQEENNKQSKMIDEMTEQLAGLTIWDIEKDEPFILGDKQEIKQYFEKKVDGENVKRRR